MGGNLGSGRRTRFPQQHGRGSRFLRLPHPLLVCLFPRLSAEHQVRGLHDNLLRTSGGGAGSREGPELRPGAVPSEALPGGARRGGRSPDPASRPDPARHLPRSAAVYRGRPRGRLCARASPPPTSRVGKLRPSAERARGWPGGQGEAKTRAPKVTRASLGLQGSSAPGAPHHHPRTQWLGLGPRRPRRTQTGGTEELEDRQLRTKRRPPEALPGPPGSPRHPAGSTGKAGPEAAPAGRPTDLTEPPSVAARELDPWGKGP